jgi:hypothetical protein
LNRRAGRPQALPRPGGDQTVALDVLMDPSYATHDEAAANLVDILAASAATSAQVLTRLQNPRAGQLLTIAQDLRHWSGVLRGSEPEAAPRLRLVE